MDNNEVDIEEREIIIRAGDIIEKYRREWSWKLKEKTLKQKNKPLLI